MAVIAPRSEVGLFLVQRRSIPSLQQPDHGLKAQHRGTWRQHPAPYWTIYPPVHIDDHKSSNQERRKDLKKGLFSGIFIPFTLLLILLNGHNEGRKMASTHPILADVSAGISELKKNPMSVVEQGEGAPVAILNRNEPVFYAVPAEAYEALMDKLEDVELAAIVRARLDQEEIEVALDDL